MDELLNISTIEEAIAYIKGNPVNGLAKKALKKVREIISQLNNPTDLWQIAETLRDKLENDNLREISASLYEKADHLLQAISKEPFPDWFNALLKKPELVPDNVRARFLQKVRQIQEAFDKTWQPVEQCQRTYEHHKGDG